MDKETAKAINNVSKRLNEVERKLDAYFNQKIDSVEHITAESYEYSKVYEVGEVCVYNNKRYECIVKCKGIEPTDKNFFVEKSLTESINESKESEEK